jgi:CDP-glycerol glycerophosphotransferase (TagB/SpsB family)
VKGLVLTVRIFLVRAAFAAGRRRPLRPRVVLATAHSAQLSGNLFAIHQELSTRRPSIPLVVLARRPARGVSGRLAAMAQAVSAGYYLATSRVIVVDDYFFPIYVIRPRDGTTIIQTWHACGAFKKVGYSLLGRSFGADEALVERVPIHSNYDVCLVASQAAIPAYAEAFRQPVERFRSDLGIPRTDVLFGDDRLAAIRAAVRAKYGLPEGRRIILFAPTFRGDSITNARTTDDLDLAVLQTALGRDHVVLVRLHPFVRSRTAIGPELAGFAIDVSDHPDIDELMLVADVLVTDYSSAIFEFALLDRPMAFFAPDYETYERERGFYFDYRTGVPGPIFETTDALATYLQTGDFDLERVARFRAASFDIADGRSTARVTDELIIPAVREAEGPR